MLETRKVTLPLPSIVMEVAWVQADSLAIPLLLAQCVWTKT
jgi:hypothetical protein